MQTYGSVSDTSWHATRRRRHQLYMYKSIYYTSEFIIYNLIIKALPIQIYYVPSNYHNVKTNLNNLTEYKGYIMLFYFNKKHYLRTYKPTF